MVAEKDNRCEKFPFQQSFINLRDGSQDFTKIMISSPRIETSFINSGSGSQNLKGIKIQCDDKSIWESFEDVARFGMATLFNYDENEPQTFSGFTFLEYLKTLAKKMGERKIETQNPVALLTKLLSSMAYGSNDESLPNNPSPTPNHLRHFSRIVQSFKNSEGRLQDFSDAKISAATGDSFNNLGSGSQTFREAEIRCAEKSSKLSRSTLPLKRDLVAHHSFNNIGKGSQCFKGFKLN